MKNDKNIKREIHPGLIEKMKNAKELRAKQLASIGINSEEELDDILHPEKFSIKSRINSKSKKLGIGIDDIELLPISDEEKSEKLKALEALDIALYHSKDRNFTNGTFCVNSSGRILKVTSGEVIYPREVIVKEYNSNIVYMMKANGSMTIAYLTSSDMSQSNFKEIREIQGYQQYGLGYCLFCRGSKVDLYYDDGISYLGWIDYEDLVTDRPWTGKAYKCGASNHLLCSITHYTVYGATRQHDGWVKTNLNLATSYYNFNIYGHDNF